jgi:hypothetical protein
VTDRIGIISSPKMKTSDASVGGRPRRNALLPASAGSARYRSPNAVAGRRSRVAESKRGRAMSEQDLIRLMQASSCFGRETCPSPPCACARSLNDALGAKQDGEIASLRAQVEILGIAGLGMQAEIASWEADCEAKDAEIDSLRAELAMALARAEKAESDYDDRKDDDLRAELVAEAEQSKICLDSYAAEHQRLSDERDAARRDAEQARTDLAAANRENDRLSSEAYNARQDAERCMQVLGADPAASP